MIESRNKIDPNFNTASMSDLVFLLLIFFMLTSTLISPNAIKILLPQSSSGQTMAKQNVTVSIDTNNQFFVENQPTPEAELQATILNYTANIQDGTIKLHADKTVPIEQGVNMMNIGKRHKYKVILGTSPE